MWEMNGKSYARVSDVIKPFVDFGTIPEEVLKRKAILGTHIHDAINQEINGNFPVLAVQEKGYMQSFYKWRDRILPIFIESEMRYYCDKIMITGCIDALIKLQGKEEAILVDFKTSAQESPIVWPMQGHLYHYLLRESGKTLAPRMLFIKLDRFGAIPKVFQYKFDNNLMNRCLQAAEDFWIKNKEPVF
jgi:hypothetical protein